MSRLFLTGHAVGRERPPLLEQTSCSDDAQKIYGEYKRRPTEKFPHWCSVGHVDAESTGGTDNVKESDSPNKFSASFSVENYHVCFACDQSKWLKYDTMTEKLLHNPSADALLSHRLNGNEQQVPLDVILQVGDITLSRVVKLILEWLHMSQNPLHFEFNVFSWVDSKGSHINMHESLISLAMELDISHMYEGPHPESMYILVSAVCCDDEGHYLCFACDEARWLIYDNKTVKSAESWQKIIQGCSQSEANLRPEILCSEHVKTQDACPGLLL